MAYNVRVPSVLHPDGQVRNQDNLRDAEKSFLPAIKHGGRHDELAKAPKVKLEKGKVVNSEASQCDQSTGWLSAKCSFSF